MQIMRSCHFNAQLIMLTLKKFIPGYAAALRIKTHTALFPRGFCDAHYRDTRRFHHPDVFVETVVRRLLLIIGSPEEDRILVAFA
jgi:hypothetical protein